jgi:hypothetical protein
MMTKKNPSLNERFPNKRMVKGFMGGAIYAAEKDGKFYVIEDEGTMAGFLEPEDRDTFNFVHVEEFASEQDRQQYLMKKGWL